MGRDCCDAGTHGGRVRKPARAAGGPDWDGDGAISADCDKLDPAQHPGAVDIPDLTFEDLNCDAMDGDSDDALFVALAGSDANVGTPNAPFQTVQHAIDVARTGAKKAIYIATGTYNQRLALGADADGIRLYGGYAAGTWARTRSSATTVNGRPRWFRARRRHGRPRSARHLARQQRRW